MGRPVAGSWSTAAKRLLHDGSTALDACEIYNDARLYLLRGMRIFIKTLWGET